MNKYTDNHLHSSFSYDSNEALEAYLKLGDDVVISTEHLDVLNPVSGGIDDVPDYLAYSKEVARLRDSYGDRIFMGVEIGYVERGMNRIRDYLSGKDFRLRLLSVHHNLRYDYMDEEVRGMDRLRVVDEYLGSMRDALYALPDANVLAHFDYGMRLLNVDRAFLSRFEERIVDIFGLVIKNNMALELNTRSLYDYGNAHIYDYVIEIYRALGGERFSLGSDAHYAGMYRYRFEDAMKRYGL